MDVVIAVAASAKRQFPLRLCRKGIHAHVGETVAIDVPLHSELAESAVTARADGSEGSDFGWLAPSLDIGTGQVCENGCHNRVAHASSDLCVHGVPQLDPIAILNDYSGEAIEGSDPAQYKTLRVIITIKRVCLRVWRCICRFRYIVVPL